jgi:uncharacterized membrane protein
MATETLVNAGFEPLAIRKITVADLRYALKKGWEDFNALPSHALFLTIIYPVVGIMIVRFIHGSSLLPMLFPMIGGFALLGPFAAVGLYELSRRREAGEEVHARHVYHLFQQHCRVSCTALGAVLFLLFVTWIVTAQAIYDTTFQGVTPASFGAFARLLFTTREGWELIIIGNLVGFLFAVVVFSISVISFPLVLDRHVSAPVAMATSIRAVAKNPGPLALWAAMIAAAMFLGSLPLFIGLIVVIPVIGHASWHLYRRMIPE